MSEVFHKISCHYRYHWWGQRILPGGDTKTLLGHKFIDFQGSLNEFSFCIFTSLSSILQLNLSHTMELIRILLVGNGGREHTLAWKLSQSPSVESIIVVPGNGGSALCEKVSNDSSVKADDYPGLVALAQKHKINLVRFLHFNLIRMLAFIRISNSIQMSN